MITTATVPFVHPKKEWSDTAKTVPHSSAIHVLEMLTCNNNNYSSISISRRRRISTTTNNHDVITIQKSSREKRGK